MSNAGMSYCSYCGTQYRLFTIFNKNMQGLTKAWKTRHERTCRHRSPEQRRAWARKYEGLGMLDSAITVELSHKGFQEQR